MARQDVLDLYRDRAMRLSDYNPDGNHELLEQLHALPQHTDFQLLYLWGPVAAGKSHLLQGLCDSFSRARKSAVYIPLALPGLEPDVLSGLENLDLVCLDDIDQRLGHTAWEDALFHLFNRLRDAGAVFVVSALCAPRDSGVCLADLKSRLSWGLVYQVQPLASRWSDDFLMQQAQQRGIELSAPVSHYILSRCARDPASLLDLLDRLDRLSLEQQRRITVPFIKQVLAQSDGNR